MAAPTVHFRFPSPSYNSQNDEPIRKGLLSIRAGLWMICIIVLVYTLTTSRRARQKDKSVVIYPWRIPVLKSTFSFVFDGYAFFQQLPQLFPDGQTVRVDILGDEIYVVQGPRNVADMFRSPVLTITRAYSLVLKQCFGMQQEAVNAYLADASGSREKPIEGSFPRPNERISYMTHENLVEGLLTTGLPTAMTNFILNLQSTLKDIPVGKEWFIFPDLTTFFEQHVGRPLLQTLYGSRLLDENPEFSREIWTYDAWVMELAKRTPSLWIPRAYSLRDKLVSEIKRWHLRGRVLVNGHSECQTVFQEDPIWGTKFMQDRYRTLLSASGQSEDSVASTNLAFMWASITNVVPSSAALLINVLEDPDLLRAVRQQLEMLPSYHSANGLSIEEVEKIPLLLSIYAETLRLNVQIHIPRSTAQHEVKIGGTVVPRNKLIMTNVMLAHMDNDVWNTQNGKHPVDEFWAERFLVDKGDPTSGPTKSYNMTHKASENQIHFSTEGLEGIWIPFGGKCKPESAVKCFITNVHSLLGGQHACPGRILAKRIMLSSLANLLINFDIELLNEESVKFESPRFGFGIRKPSHKVGFKLRRRSLPPKNSPSFNVDIS